MGIQYSKSIRVGNHIRMNLSQSGVGMSVGVPGLRVGTGPHGSRLTASIPGTGLRYSKKLGSSKSQEPKSEPGTENSLLGDVAKVAAVSVAAAIINHLWSQKPSQPTVRIAYIPNPDILAPSYEKEFVKALKDYRDGKKIEALHHFVKAVRHEPGAGLLAATIYAEHEEGIDNAIMLLEAIIKADIQFPTPMMQKYMRENILVELDITPSVSVNVPTGALLVTLLLVELYQKQGKIEEAVGLLKQVEEFSGVPAVTLSLCELYSYLEDWDSIIEQANHVQIEDDITFETVLFYGRALQEKGLHAEAIRIFGEALKQNKACETVLLQEARYWQAFSYEQLGRKSQANKKFQKLFKDNPYFRDVAQRVVQNPQPTNIFERVKRLGEDVVDGIEDLKHGG